MQSGQQVNPIIVIAACVAVFAVIGFFGYRAMTPPTPAAGSYTPGTPPWLDKGNPQYGKGPQIPHSQGQNPAPMSTTAPH